MSVSKRIPNAIALYYFIGKKYKQKTKKVNDTGNKELPCGKSVWKYKKLLLLHTCEVRGKEVVHIETAFLALATDLRKKLVEGRVK